MALNLLTIQLFGLLFLHRDYQHPTAFATNDRQGSQRHPMLDFPLGKAVALPSVRVGERKGTSNKNGHQDNYYGGKGDKPHLGGFANNNVGMEGVSPATWKLIIEKHGIKSLLDVGCGRGVSTSWFHMHGVDAKCVEGSHDAWEQSLIPNQLRTEHDFSRGYVAMCATLELHT
jgi:hypothetical protein